MTLPSSPIGIFDSGLGGLSVWREIRQQFPQESLVYYADQAHCPYGPRPAIEIVRFSHAISHFLHQFPCKLIVLACNTATAAAIASLRQSFPVPFVGMEPAIKPAAAQSQSQVIGVLATRGTLRGGHFQRTLQRFAEGKEVWIQEGKGLVELVEKGEQHSPEARQLLQEYLQPMINAGADQIVLGCTHYPFFEPLLSELVGPGISIVDPAPAVARRVGAVLAQAEKLAPADQQPSYSFFTSGESAALQYFMQEAQLLPEAVISAETAHKTADNPPFVFAHKPL